MKLFIDTEFSSLEKRNSRLVSIGLIAEDGREFYAELPKHTWSFKCSDFVLEIVEPVLWHGSYSMTPAELSAALRDWLTQFDQVEIVTDSPDWDFWFLCLILEVDKDAGWPANVSRKPCRFDPEGATIHDSKDLAARESFEHYWTDKTHFRHHALHDAKALRLAWLARHRGRPAE